MRPIAGGGRLPDERPLPTPRSRVGVAARWFGLLALVAFGCGREDDASAGADAAATSARSRPVDVRVAAASNFAFPLRALSRAFSDATGFRVEASTASTGKLYAQIRAGAPFDVFLAADAASPERLVDEGFAEPASLRRYATGALVVVAYRGRIASNVPTEPAAPSNGPEPPACLAPLLDEDADARHTIAIANPETAPYGRAARQTLERLALWTAIRGRLVRGENVSQALQFVDTGNASAGLVARSQRIAYRGDRLSPCHWNVPSTFHDPIEQKMVVLSRSADRPAVAAFARFMASEEAAGILRESGYTP